MGEQLQGASKENEIAHFLSELWKNEKQHNDDAEWLAEEEEKLVVNSCVIL